MEQHFDYKIKLDLLGNSEQSTPNFHSSSSLAVNGRNVSLINRNPNNFTSSPKSFLNNNFTTDKNYYCGNLNPIPESTKNIRSKKKSKSVSSKRESKKTSLPRKSFNIPVKSLPGCVLEGSTEGGYNGGNKGSDRAAVSPCSLTPCERSNRIEGKADYPFDVRPCHVRPLHLENKVVIQIREANQVNDFKRILSSNAILSGRTRHRGRTPPLPSEMFRSATVNRPHSSYSMFSVNETYNQLFQCHLDSLQSLVDHQFSVESGDLRGEQKPVDYLDSENLYEDLYNLPEYYQYGVPNAEVHSDSSVIESTCETPAVNENDSHCSNNNFNVNLSDLISVGNNNKRDRLSNASIDELINFNTTPTEAGSVLKEGDLFIMSTTRQKQIADCHSIRRDSCDDIGELGRSVSELDINRGGLPVITLSECREPKGYSSRDRPGAQTALNLSVPSVECGVEARPPVEQ